MGGLNEDVARLLEASKAAHLAYLQEDRSAPNANYAYCEKRVAEALALRVEAHAIDPEHKAPIWRDDECRWPHEQLLEFYRRYPEIP